MSNLIRMSDKSFWKKYFRTEVIDNKNVHFCSACDFSTTIQKDMSFHVRKHLKKTYPFACDDSNCDKAFKTKAALADHRVNHRCGFGIDGMQEIGICGANELKGHYEMIVDNNRFKYICKWMACQYVISHVDSIERHVHKHVCPYRK